MYLLHAYKLEEQEEEREKWTYAALPLELH